MTDDEKVEAALEVPEGLKVEPPCPAHRQRTRLVEEEFAHTRKRLARAKIATLVQLSVFAYDCVDQGHPPGSFHIDFSTMGSEVQVPGGLQASIVAVEALLAALKKRVQ